MKLGTETFEQRRRPVKAAVSCWIHMVYILYVCPRK